MKKLMFVAAALTAGFAMAEIQSSNIVGYSQSTLQNGFTMVTPQFVDCTGAQMDVQDLVATGTKVVDNVKIQFLNSFGITTNTVMWADGSDLDEKEEGYCWSDPSWEAKIVGLKLAPGQGLWVSGKTTAQNVQSSGAVSTSDAFVRLCNGFTPCGNPFPVEYDLQDLTASGTKVVDNVKIQFLNSFGITTNTVMWADGSDLEEKEEGYCWSDPSWEAKITGVKIAPGQGLWVSGKNTDQYLVFPHPEL